MTTPTETSQEKVSGARGVVAPVAPRIVWHPDVCGGEPRIDGTRMPVRSLLAILSTCAGVHEHFKAAFPYLTEGEINAALDWTHGVVASMSLHRVPALLKGDVRAPDARSKPLVIGWRLCNGHMFARGPEAASGSSTYRKDAFLFDTLEEAREARRVRSADWRVSGRLLCVSRKPKAPVPA